MLAARVRNEIAAGACNCICDQFTQLERAIDYWHFSDSIFCFTVRSEKEAARGHVIRVSVRKL